MRYEKIYQEYILDHFYHPRNRMVLDKPDFHVEERNFSCGDKITIQGMLIGKLVDVVVFTGTGCVLSQATASVLTEHIRGKSILYVEALDYNVLQKLIRITVSYGRIQCVLLPLQALKQSLDPWIKKERDHAQSCKGGGIT